MPERNRDEESDGGEYGRNQVRDISVLPRARARRNNFTVTRTPRCRHLPAPPAPCPETFDQPAVHPAASPPHPVSTARYCLPSIANVVGGATMPELVANSHSSLPLAASNA